MTRTQSKDFGEVVMYWTGDGGAALRAADRGDWRPLTEVWRKRFEALEGF